MKLNYKTLKEHYDLVCRNSAEKSDTISSLQRELNAVRAEHGQLSDENTKLEASNKNLKQAVNALGIVISHL